MQGLSRYALWAFVASAAAQSITLDGTMTATEPDYPTGTQATYHSYQSSSSLNTRYTFISGRQSTVASNATFTSGSTTSSSTGTGSVTVISGSAPTTTASGNATSTSSSSTPVNTQACNGYPELCNRKYSNVTYVAAHNSPFIRPGNAASNQALDVTTQLNDGVRMLQFQVHQLNNTIRLCHTSCDLLDVGLLTDYLANVTNWLNNNQYEVVTILMGNYELLPASTYEQAIVDSGITDYVYIPPTVPMGLDGWPTLGEMILTNARVVFMMDYNADQDTMPWLLDEFSYMWETPFSPTDSAFPCTAQRPPDQAHAVYEDRMSIANHNLNVDIAFAGLSILVPAYNALNETNAVSGYGSAGAAVSNCTAMWNRPPNFILVDYYNIGNFNGSVLAVAAEANNVTYNQNSCCGSAATSAGMRLSLSRDGGIAVIMSMMVAFVLTV